MSQGIRAPFRLSAELQELIFHFGEKPMELTLREKKDMAAAILKASDFYIQNPDEQTPWSEPWMKVAQIFYYLPLNFLRAQSVVRTGMHQGFFTDLTRFIDYGAGLGAAAYALNEIQSWRSQILVERSSPARAMMQALTPFKSATIFSENEFKHFKLKTEKTLVCFSYSLTENGALPPWALDAEALMIIEPSTQDDGRKLLQLRERLKTEGYDIWAPCTHQEECPLLKESKRDWCHDRIHFEQPEWFKMIEQELPMRNATLTMSYLLARRTPQTSRVKLARVIGDTLPENGKTRQLICRSSQREFLAWMHRKAEVQQIPRGVLVEVPDEAPKVSNELRVTKTLRVHSGQG